MPVITSNLYNRNQSGELQLCGMENQPIRTDGCIILICTEGRAKVSVNFRKRKYTKGDIALIMPDVFFTPLSVSLNCKAKYIAFDEATMEQTFFKIASKFLWEYIYINPILSLRQSRLNRLMLWYQQMEWICGESKFENRMQILSNEVLNLFLVLEDELRGIAHDDTLYAKDRSWTICGEFCNLVVKNAREHHDAGFYARKLCITPDYLYKITTKLMSTTPKEMIDQQLVAEIKTLLSGSDLSVKSIANRLGFEDSSYMCRFFRRITGQSPMEYRNIR